MKKTILLLTLSSLLVGCGYEIVDTGHRGIKVSLGEVVGEPLPEGLHFYNPLTSDVREFNVREEKWESQTAIFTRDTQQVTVEFAVTYYADPKFVNTIYREVGDEAALTEKIIRPVALGSLKDAIGQVIADELVSKRETVTKSALAEVKENLAARHVVVTDLQFTNLDFDDAYEQAVEAKVVATQHAQKAVNETVTIREKAKQTVLSAEAEANAMRIKTQALSQSKGLVEFEAVQKWNGVLPVNIYGSAPIPFLSLGKN
jgi:regulator of protease activity HflC (stomatin/prohibitin superfamily)